MYKTVYFTDYFHMFRNLYLRHCTFYICNYRKGKLNLFQNCNILVSMDNYYFHQVV